MVNVRSTNARILIVEDDPLFQHVLGSALTVAGHSFEVAADGRQAERWLSSHSFDLVITDVLMPVQDGLQLIMNLRAASSALPVIAMTGSHTYTDIYLKTAAALGAKRVLEKPFKMSKLLNTVSEALGRSKSPFDRVFVKSPHLRNCR